MPYLDVNLSDYDDFEDHQQALKKKSKKPRVKKSFRDIANEHFEDDGLEHLNRLGYIDEVTAEIKSGKEASVYLVRYKDDYLAAKIYKDMQVRSFKNDAIYTQGRYIGDPRVAKAIAQGSSFGRAAQQAIWSAYEYHYLWQFYQAGLAVPKPMIGPNKTAISAAGPVVLMEFIGDETTPAPRLSDIRLKDDIADDAFEQSVALMRALLEQGLVHGDFSTYNLLWHKNRVIMIDFPQIGHIDENPAFWQLLERDVVSLCTSFKKHGVIRDAQAVYEYLLLSVG